MKNFKKLALAAACAGSAIAASMPAQAANWLMLQGTEKPGAVGAAKVWGFVQPDFQYTDGTTVQSGAFKGAPAQFNMHQADLKSRATFNIRRARIGVRGQGFPLDNKVNYFLLSEFGHNGITVPGKDGGAALSDASVTLNHIPGARMRVGQFKYPGAEEGLQAVHTMDYVNFTNFTEMVLFERFFDSDGSDTVYSPNATQANGKYKDNGNVNAPVSRDAFRDVGFQLFDTFNFGGLETSYALMAGNGNGINRMDNNGKKDFYYYLSSEKVFGGEGVRREGVKAFAWHHTGSRTLSGAGAGTYDMTRSGLGATFRKGKYRAAAEYMMADGMIYTGSDGGAVPGSEVTVDTAKVPAASTASCAGTCTATSSFNLATDDQADGFYVDLGYMVTPKIELDFRYDTINRATKVDANLRVFTTMTVGAQYFFNKKTRLVVNYDFRTAEAPHNANADKIVSEIDDRLAVTLLAIF